MTNALQSNGAGAVHTAYPGSSQNRLLVLFTDGFEEVELVTTVDICRRSGVDVTTASLDSVHVLGGHGLFIQADTVLQQVDGMDYDMLYLNGGAHCVETMALSTDVERITRYFWHINKWVAAICAAPYIIWKFGLLQNKHFTCHPGYREKIHSGHYESKAVVRDGHFLSSQGAGTAARLAREISSILVSDKAANTALLDMIY